MCVDRGYYKDFADEDARQIVEDAIAEDTGIDGYAVGKLLSVYGNAKGQKLAKDFFRANAVRYIKDTCNVMWNYRTIELSAYGLNCATAMTVCITCVLPSRRRVSYWLTRWNIG